MDKTIRSKPILLKYPPFSILILFLLMGAGSVFPDRADCLEAVVLQVHYRNARELLPIVRSLLTSAGSATADSRTNSLVVIDTDQSLSAVRGLLDRLDRPLHQYRILVRFDSVERTADQSATAEGRISGDGWTISKGESPTDGIHIRLEDKTVAKSRPSTYSVITGAGRAAYIRVGRDIPYRTRWRRLCGKYGPCPEDIVYKRIDTGMEITPIPAGDRITLEITPRISEAEKTGAIRFAGASTMLTVPLNTWVPIGGADETENEAIRAVLETRAGENVSMLSMSVRVEILP